MRKKDDVRKYVVRREIKKGDKTFYKAPKIQRLITEKRLRRKKLDKKHKIEAFKAKKDARAKYEKVLSQYIKERKALHHKHDEKEEAAKPKVEAKKAPVAGGKVDPKAKAAPHKAEEKKAPAKAAPAQADPKKNVEKATAKAAPKKGGK